MLRIAFVTLEFGPQSRGGSGRYATMLARGLALRGHIVDVFSPPGPGPYPGHMNRVEYASMRHIVIKPPRLLPSVPGFWLGLLSKISEVGNNTSYDVLHSNSVAGFPAINHPTPTVLTLHHLPRARGSRRSGDGSAREALMEMTYLALAQKMLAFRAQRIITVSKFTADQVLATYPELALKIRVVQNGVPPLSEPTQASDSSQTRRKFLSQGGKIILFVGRPEPRKGLDLLLDALRWGRSKGWFADTRLIIVGRGEWERYLDQAKVRHESGHIITTGFVSDEDLFSLYRAADVVVVPSDMEGFGFVPLEAASTGAKVVMARVGIAAEEELPGNVFVVPRRTPESFALAIHDALERNVTSGASTTTDTDWFAKHSWDAAVRATERVYEEAIDAQR